MVSQGHLDPRKCQVMGRNATCCMGAIEECRGGSLGFWEIGKGELLNQHKEMLEYLKGLQEEDYYRIWQIALYFINSFKSGGIPLPGITIMLSRVHTKRWDIRGWQKQCSGSPESYKWPYMSRAIFKTIINCPKCAINKSGRDMVPPAVMLIVLFPSQLVSADLCGPFPLSHKGNCYIRMVIDHCNGWVEVKPLPTKTSVLDFIALGKFVNAQPAGGMGRANRPHPLGAKVVHFLGDKLYPFLPRLWA